MQDFIKHQYNGKVNLLKTWRNRYSSTDYPEKMIINLLYELLTTEKIWDELLLYFNTIDYNNNRKFYDEFSDAHHFIFIRRRCIALNIIRPNLTDQYKKRSDVGNLNFKGIKSRVKSASKGDSKNLEELEYTYIYYSLGHELIYSWAACGLLGMNKEEAYKTVSTIQLENVNYNSYSSMEDAFNKAIGFQLVNPFTGEGIYTPLPSL